MSAVEGDVVNMSCMVDSDPHYTVTRRWYRNSLLVDVQSKAISVDAEGNLVLASVSASDAGLYTCAVESGGGRDISSGWLRVIGQLVTSAMSYY